MILSCIDFEKAGVYSCEQCCSSCHTDEWLGYTALQIDEPPSKTGKMQFHINPRIFAYACCGFRSADTVLTRSDWAKTVLTKRRESR